MSHDEWWRRTTVYQIYPRSYKDSTGNGIGDLPGIIEKLDYLAELGIETIWLSPIYPSPQEDHGYDISDYRNINPEYGTMADFDRMLKKAHDLGLRIVLDMVLNHSSDKHPWFIESKSSRDNPKRDWYIWRDGRKPGGKAPPNNWKAMPGGPAWRYDPGTEQWYYFHFLPFQPDLNWWNPNVQKEMYDTVRYWLDKGVDGFRLDIFHAVYQDKNFKNNPFSFRVLPSENSTASLFQNHVNDLHLPETFELARNLRKILDEYDPPRFMVGEITATPEICHKYMGGAANDGLHLTFQFNFLRCRFNARQLARQIKHNERVFMHPALPTYVYSNHDLMRIFTRVSENWDKMKVLATLQLTLRGVPFIYYGDEIGMSQVKVKLKTSEDPIGRKFWWSPIKQSKYFAFAFSRDGCRTPMQWNSEPNAGFSPDEEVKTWLRIGPKYKKVNVAIQDKNPNSLLNTYRTLLQVRRENIALQAGSFEFLHESSGALVYKRTHPEQVIIVALNFKKKRNFISLASPRLELIFSTDIKAGETDAWKTDATLNLKPYEGMILREMQSGS
ncbi:MAG: glycoside hydrolase family 13 protein [Candidatus Helarchaeota archaeon]